MCFLRNGVPNTAAMAMFAESFSSLHLAKYCLYYKIVLGLSLFATWLRKSIMYSSVLWPLIDTYPTLALIHLVDMHTEMHVLSH